VIYSYTLRHETLNSNVYGRFISSIGIETIEYERNLIQCKSPLFLAGFVL
jgi:hypothetical protein